MEDTLKIKSFLKILEKVGYPNPKIVSISDMVDYNLDYFLVDLKNEIGEEGVVDFCDKAIEKLSDGKAIKVDLETDGQEYVVVNVFPLYYDEDEAENDVISRVEFVDSKIFSVDEDGKDVYKTIPEIQDDVSMGDWAEYDEMMDHIKMKVYNYIFSRCGFGIWVE
jgi:autonomous glycyl radical cofactor GrcA